VTITTDRAGRTGAAEETGVDAALLERLRPFLAESIMVLDHDWSIKANLAPPGGLIGRGLGLGTHTLEDMHPDDAILIMDLGIQAFSTEHGWRGSKVVRQRNGDGVWGRYEITAINQFDDPVIAGMVVRTRELPREEGTEDITGIERTSAIETLAELLPLGVLLLDGRGHAVFANGTACTMLGRDHESIKHFGLQPSVVAADRHHVDDIVRRLAATPGRERCTVRLHDTGIERVECSFTSEGADEISSIVVTLEDVTEREALQRDLEERANHDPLTGLLNRSALHTLLQHRLDRHVPTMVAYIDLDGFKAVNDTWGHERGDQLLAAVGGALRAAVGDDAELARLGGDEFVIITDPQAYSYEGLGHQLQDAVTAVTRADGLQITCSVGLSVALDEDGCHDVLRRADHAMYAAKSRRD
jgi:diguanylate cyclase (GGDEF)-like protein